MGLLILVTGIFLGISIALATLYSLAQVVLTEGRQRLAHGAALAATLAVMAALQWGTVPVARALAIPLLAAAIAAFAVERRWYRVFPMIQQLFAAVLLLGLVEM